MMTVDDELALLQVVKRDRRYSLEAYLFVRDALSYASDILEMGSETVTELGPGMKSKVEHHLTGQELCEALRIFALNQFGPMSPIVLRNWGIHATTDFGEIVYNMIGAGLMKKSSGDRRSHFDDVFDFSTAFQDDFKSCRLKLSS